MHLNSKHSFLRRASGFAAAHILLISAFAPLAGKPVFARADSQPESIAINEPTQPQAPEGTWFPGAGTTFTYTLSTTSFSLSADALLPFTPNLSSAGYFLYDPATGATQSFVANAVSIAGGARISASAIPLLTSGQDIQFFIFPAGGGAADFSPRYKIYRLTSLYLPMIQTPGLLEPNNSACDATPATANTTYVGKNDDVYDWFSFTLDATSDFSVTVSDFPTLGYLELWAGSDCNSLTLAQPIPLPSPADSPTVARTAQPAGTYFFRIVSVAANNLPYSFRWTYTESRGELEPNNTACTATTAAADTAYGGRDDDPQDWFKIELTGTARATFTMTNFGGSAGALKVYSSTNANCAQLSAAPVATFTIGGAQNVLNADLTSGTYYALVSNTGTNSQTPYTFRWAPAFTTVDVMEPNNTICTAATLSLDRAYKTYAEDGEDWFAFTIPITGRVQIVFSGMPAASTSPLNTGTWLTIYRENGNCNNTPTRVDLAAPDNVNPAIYGNYVMAMQNQPPGKYYIFVNRLTAFNTTQPYQIRITQGDIGVWAPKVMSCVSQEFGCSKQTAGQVVVYYYGMMVGTQLNLRLGGLSCGTLCTGCPIGQANPATGFTTVRESGVYTFTGVSTGYYGLYADATSPIYGIWGDQKPIKMDCDFLLANASENRFDLGLEP